MCAVYQQPPCIGELNKGNSPIDKGLHNNQHGVLQPAWRSITFMPDSTTLQSCVLCYPHHGLTRTGEKPPPVRVNT